MEELLEAPRRKIFRCQRRDAIKGKIERPQMFETQNFVGDEAQSIGRQVDLKWERAENDR